MSFGTIEIMNESTLETDSGGHFYTGELGNKCLTVRFIKFSTIRAHATHIPKSIGSICFVTGPFIPFIFGRLFPSGITEIDVSSQSSTSYLVDLYVQPGNPKKYVLYTHSLLFSDCAGHCISIADPSTTHNDEPRTLLVFICLNPLCFVFRTSLAR